MTHDGPQERLDHGTIAIAASSNPTADVGEGNALVVLLEDRVQRHAGADARNGEDHLEQPAQEHARVRAPADGGDTARPGGRATHYPIELLADDTPLLRRLTRSGSGEVSNRVAPARVALAPSRAVYVIDERPSVVVKGHPVAPVAVVAASIAADPARGAEIVEQWELTDRAW